MNFRDVGEWLQTISGETLLPARRLLRGGRLNQVDHASQIGSPGTIINLRRGADPEDKHFGAEARHFPISNDHEVYETHTPHVRRWLCAILECLATDVTRYPVLIHCTSGKDRTGVVVAALLLTLGVRREHIIEEYLLSEGATHRDWITQALDGIGEPSTYFHRIDLHSLQRKLPGV